ncbi:MAG TPA: Fe-S cluster assembly ATPase SufC [Coxiellaceae bacterium]|nr:Fe-S cluster assembly ATPase SufC [Coxiellaceae bacterium]
MLDIQSLYVNAGDREILKGLDLSVKAGEVHAIMGPNGSGKSTLANALAGREDLTVLSGQVTVLDESLLDLSVEERAALGVFLAFQYPVEIPGVNNLYFLKAAVNSLRVQRGESELDSFDFMKMVKSEIKHVGLDESFLKRAVNAGFSGGEKKRNEILQMALLQPKLAILDETDSGLDIDALRIVADGVNRMRSSERAIILVTHYQRLLDYIEPDYIHVLIDGRIVDSGDKSLAVQLEKNGYAAYQTVGSNA